MTNTENQKPAVTPIAATAGANKMPVGTMPTANDHQMADKLHAEIKKNWGRLSDEEIKLHSSQPDQFYSKLKEKHGVNKEDAQKRLSEIKTSCGCGSEKAA